MLALSATTAHAAKPVASLSDSALHAYVIGRYAELDNQVGLAARLMEEARAADPLAANVKRRSWELALANGDQARTFLLARSLAAAGATDPDVTMTRIAEAMIRKDWALAASLRQKLGGQGWPIVIGPVVDAWVAQARGDAGAALNLLDPQRHQGFLRAYIAEQRAHLLASLGRWDEAATAYRQARAGGGPALLFLRQGQADALVLAGRRDEALAVLYPADRPTAVARERLQAGKRLGPLVAEPRQALAWTAARLSVDLARERSEPMALMFARLASFMAPELPITWLTVGDMLGKAGHTQPALAALDKVPAGLGLEEAVRARRAEVLEAAGQSAAAGQLLQRAAEAPGASADDWTGLAGWHSRAARFAEAASAYGTAIDRFGAAMGASAWNLHYLRGMMRDRAGDWPSAQADFRAALALFPDEPGVLNYLGYGLLERGSTAAEARTMIEKAAQLRPGDGGIIDSLGWAQLQTGEVDKAVATLERAISLEPQDATIVGHLGDALWQQGRRIEARFRWRQALGLDASPDDKRKLQARLDYGLDAAPAMLALK
ncbi:tetratricopeptide repeat protein [Sandarakinorhabdus sp.]|uniref:tetratricopeptide repeat protein n=1 Tax=Sandarakinorhabdus sp. TaxID=1916663 RepID=UPI00286DF081|nr:tetratricopeptide repeat protein [Sandarakinorhabdus sp.]